MPNKILLYLFVYLFFTIFAGFIISAIIDAFYKFMFNNAKESTVRPGYELSMLSGIIERSVYITSLLLGFPQFVAIWLGLKSAGVWNHWHSPKDLVESNKKAGRSGYMIFLNGTALSLAFSVIGWKTIFWAKMGKFDFILIAIVLLLFCCGALSAVLWYKIKNKPMGDLIE